MTVAVSFLNRLNSLKKTLVLKLGLIAATGGILFGHFMVHQFCLPAETALRLTEASMIADGSRMYVDFLDNATPYYLYVNLVPVLISRLLYVHSIAIVNVLTATMFMLAAAVITLVQSASGRRNPLNSSYWLILSAFFAITILQLQHFAQANQIFFMALVPYVIVRACTARAQKLPVYLTAGVGAAMALAALVDPLYGLFVLLLECFLLASVLTVGSKKFVLQRFGGPEVKVFFVLYLALTALILILPTSSSSQYFSYILRINYYSFVESLHALNFNGCASDSRNLIYLATFLLIGSLPARQNILVRYFSIVSMLGLGLMLFQGATLFYQTYIFVGGAAMAMAAAVPDYLRRMKVLNRLKAVALKFPRLNLVGQQKQSLACIFGVLLTFALATYAIELAQIPRAYRYDLTALGYYGQADKRDLAVFSEAVEEYSQVKKPVAILGLGVRPAYPVMTQLRRTPGLSLCWGFVIDPLEILEEPFYAKDMLPLRRFKTELYAKMTSQLASPDKAPSLLMIDGEEVRRVLEEHGIIKVIDDNYGICGGASVEDAATKDGHPPVENIGYRSGYTIYRHRKLH